MLLIYLVFQPTWQYFAFLHFQIICLCIAKDRIILEQRNYCDQFLKENNVEMKTVPIESETPYSILFYVF